MFMRSVLLCLSLCLASSAHANSSNTDATDGGANSTEDAFFVEAEARSVGDPVAQADSVVSVVRNGLDGASPAALTKAELCRTAASEATANNLPARFFANLIQQESGFRPDVVSPAGAQGIAQFMPPVASSYGLANPFEPVAALQASAKLLADLVEQFGNLGLAAAAYNAGPKRVQDWMDKRRNLPAETRHYVHKITGRPAEHWVNQRKNVSEVSFPTYANCDLPVIAMRTNPISSAGVKISYGSKRYVSFVPVAQNQPGLSASNQSGLSASVRSSKPQFLRVVKDLLTRRVADNSHRETSARARLSAPGPSPGSSISRFVAMPTPVIMAEEKVQSPRHAGPDKKRPQGSLPRPSEFIVGARVPAAIKASEAAVLAGRKTPARWTKEMKKTRVADAGSSRLER
jgi:hypothetical protein